MLYRDFIVEAFCLLVEKLCDRFPEMKSYEPVLVCVPLSDVNEDIQSFGRREIEDDFRPRHSVEGRLRNLDKHGAFEDEVDAVFLKLVAAEYLTDLLEEKALAWDEQGLC